MVAANSIAPVSIYEPSLLYCTCLLCFFAHEMNFPRSLFFSYSKRYKNAGKNQSPCYLHVLKLITWQVNVSTRMVPGGKHLGSLMLVAKLLLTPMGGGRHPNLTSA